VKKALASLNYLSEVSPDKVRVYIALCINTL